MSETEDVLSRWSRLKRRASQREGATRAPDAGEAHAQERRAQEHAMTAQAPAPGVDVGGLPPIESIVAGSDIRAFLQQGVPAALTRAALRQAWSSDPAIRDFIELAENQWDFARPETIPGFGPLEATDEVQRLVAQALGEWREQSPSMGPGHAHEGAVAPTQAVGSERAAPHSGDAPEILTDHGKVGASDPEPVRAVQHAESAIASNNTPARRRRRHGGALPL